MINALGQTINVPKAPPRIGFQKLAQALDHGDLELHQSSHVRIGAVEEHHG